MAERALVAVPNVSCQPDPDLYFKADRAFVCIDCSGVYALPRQTCPACGSGAGLALRIVLDSKLNRELVAGLRVCSRAMAAARTPKLPIARTGPEEKGV